MDKIGERVKKIRSLLNLSQGELARQCLISKQAVSNIENSKSMPGILFLKYLHNNYHVNLNYLIGGKGECFVTNIKSFANLRKSLIKDVEHFFDLNGIK